MARRQPRQNRIEPEDIDPVWGGWLAGLVDGEGYFMFRLDRKGIPKAKLEINLRSDERAGLVEIKQTLGIGRIFTTTDRAIRWDVARLNDCLWLARFFELYPLRLKKARDFTIWAAAIRAWANGAARNDLRAYATKIRAVRQFEAEPYVPTVAVSEQTPLGI